MMKFKINTKTWLIILMIIGFIMRIYNLDGQSVWLDEIHSLNEANPDLSFLEVYNSVFVSEQMPPLYYFILYFLFKVFGYKVFVLRLVSVLCGTAAIYAIFKLAKLYFNEKVGLIAALLLCVNPYLIHYSQEGRPYMFFCLFVIISFYYLIKYLKEFSNKNLILYGVSSLLMIYGHFFGLAVLFTQALIISYCYLIIKKDLKSFFIHNGLLSIFLIIFYYPSYKILFRVNSMGDFWIPNPTDESMTLIFKEFFNNSEILLFLLIIPFVLFITTLKDKFDDISKYLNSYLIVICWIFMVILIPYLRSYISVPMLISRYFICIIPALLIIFSLGYTQIKNSKLLYSFLGIFVICSITNIVFVRSYYSGVNKTQFREVTQAIQTDKTPTVVSSLSWYLPYFFNNKQIIDADLNNYISKLKNNEIALKSFWYFDAHGRKFDITPENLDFLQQEFVEENTIELFDAWAKLYTLKSELKSSFEITKAEIDFSNSKQIYYNLETNTETNGLLEVTGWAHFKDEDTSGNLIQLVLVLDNTAVEIIPTTKVLRKDVTSYFKSPVNLDNSGFKGILNLDEKYKGKEYKIGLYLESTKNGKKSLIIL